MTRKTILSTAAFASLAFCALSAVPATAGTTTTETTTTITKENPHAKKGEVNKTVTVIKEEKTKTDPVTVSTTTMVNQKIIPGAKALNFVDFDLDKDGILSRKEVGQKLFYVFDTDGNGVLDNIEFKRNAIITLIPLEKTELTMIDLDDDGKPDITNVTSEDFMDHSMLARFDKDQDGVSPTDFIDKSFYRVDTDNSGVVEFAEWKEVYDQSRSPLNAKQWRYNQ